MMKTQKKEPIPAPRARFNWRLLLSLVLTTAVVCAAYYVLIYFEIQAVFWVYLGITCILAILFFWFNRGFSTKPLEEDMLPEDWDAARRAEYLREDRAAKKKAKKLLVPLLAFLLTFLIDVINLFYGDFFTALFR